MAGVFFNKDQSKIYHICEKYYGYGSGALAAQCIATIAVGLTFAGNGILVSAPIFVLGNVLNSKHDVLSLNEEQASWFGSIPALCTPVGNFMGIVLLDFCGQRYGLFLSNTFGLVSLLTLHYASAPSTALLSSVAAGLSLGFTEPSGMGYMSEYSEPKFRGLLTFSTIFMLNFGMLLFSFIASTVNWRALLLMSATVPLVSALLLTWIPNSPVWLLSKGRRKEALKALSWFRGWVKEDDVQDEFDDLEKYVKMSLMYNKRTTVDAEQTPLLGEESSHGNQSNLSELLSNIIQKRTLYPLFFMTFFQLIIYIAQGIGVSAYSMNYFDSLHLPFDSYFLVFVSYFGSAVGTFVFMVVLKYAGKRSVSLLAVFLMASMSISTGIFIHYKDELRMPWIYVAILLFLGFGNSQSKIPSLMVGELLPVRTRNAGSGLNSATSSIIQFFFVKTYFATVRTLGIELYFLMSGILGMIGCLLLYIFLPETEGKSLSEIEDIFSKTSATENEPEPT